MKKIFCLLICGLIALDAASAQAVRLKDLVDVEGVRSNDLIGYGIVVGLGGTGDTLRNSPYTEEALSSLLERLGVNVQDERFRPDNIAAVIVTATLPPFARAGSRIDVTVSSIGDADSLDGGMLIMTPLLGADNKVYAVAQGPLVVGGFSAQGQGAAVRSNSQTIGTIAAGARVEREIPFTFTDLTEIHLALKDPDFTTAGRIEVALNTTFPGTPARMTDAGTVILDAASTGLGAAHLIAQIEGIPLTPDRRARVVIDQRSGTIVLGSDVRIAPVAVAQGALTIRVTETPIAVPAAPFSEDGTPVVLPRTDIGVFEGGDVASLETGASLRDLVEGLNALDVPPRDMVEIFEALRAAGALHAEIVLQ
ncbi:MAG: flagellar basal body P-ring protein FlgI [Pseudomonadota bacterium]